MKKFFIITFSILTLYFMGISAVLTYKIASLKKVDDRYFATTKDGRLMPMRPVGGNEIDKPRYYSGNERGQN